jgi:predicted transcriptional regulator YdeE
MGQMSKCITEFAEIKLVGITARTSNAREMNPETAKIGATMQKFFGNSMQSQISERKNPGTVFAVYTNYESDEHGDYTYFLGEEVNDITDIQPGFEVLTIPVQSYAKFTSAPGKMPAVCIEMWQDIWKMKAADFGGARSYIADFEVYDERSQDPEGTVLDIYIGIKF